MTQGRGASVHRGEERGVWASEHTPYHPAVRHEHVSLVNEANGSGGHFGRSFWGLEGQSGSFFLSFLGERVGLAVFW